MMKRISLSDEDIELIVAALDKLHQSSIVNHENYPQYELASKQRMLQIKSKLARKV